MADSSSIPPSQRGSNTQSTRKKGRRATQLKELTLSRRGDQRISIQFDQSTGNPLGPNKKKFVSFVALQARSKVNILMTDWDHVEESVKNQIWQTIMGTYEVPNTDFLRRKWISYAGERWRAFKTDLTSKYIFGELRNKSPLEVYAFLDEETWQRFVESRLDPAFQEKRKKAQEIQKKNLHPHILSRGGYELLVQKIVEEKKKQRQKASQSGPPQVVDPPSPPPRHEKWKKARLKKSGEYTSEDTRLVAEKIDSLVQQSLQGSFVPHGRQDILTTAIGKPEHGGRVLTAGRGVGIRQYYGPPSHYRPTTGGITREVMEVLKAEIREEIHRELASMGLFQQNIPAQPSRHVSTEESCASEDMSEDHHIDSEDQCSHTL